MDVNQTNSVAPVHADGRQPQQGRDHAKDQEQQKQDDKTQSGSWRDKDAVDFDHRLIDALTPEIQGVIDRLAREVEPLRRKLAGAERQLEEQRALASRHRFLDIPSLTEMIRDLEHVLSHKANLSTPPYLVMFIVTNGDRVRQQFGRRGLQLFLSAICQRVSEAMPSSDIFGSLGGNDFALIMLGASPDTVDQAVTNLCDAVQGEPVFVEGQQVAVEVRAAALDLGAYGDAQAAIEAADRLVCRASNSH